MADKSTTTRGEGKGSASASSRNADEPELPWNQDFDRMAKMAPSSKYDKMNKPFAATDPSKVPTIGEQWAYAARRYSKYQGYAWSGVLCVAGIAFLGSMVTSPKEEEERKVEEGKRT